jgi:arsenate reductase
MAEAFFNYFSKKYRAISAGIKPDKRIHPWTIKVMREVRIDVNQQLPKLLTKRMLKEADKIIVMDSELLKEIPLKYSPKLEEWKIEKLLGKPIGQIRKIRDQIKKKVKKLINEIE